MPKGRRTRPENETAGAAVIDWKDPAANTHVLDWRSRAADFGLSRRPGRPPTRSPLDLIGDEDREALAPQQLDADDDVVLDDDEAEAGDEGTAEDEDELVDGVDELGVLLYGHAKGAYWFGSQLSLEETRALAPAIKRDQQPRHAMISLTLLDCVEGIL